MLTTNVSHAWDNGFNIYLEYTPDPVVIETGGTRQELNLQNSTTHIELKTFQLGKGAICIPLSSLNSYFKFDTDLIDFQVKEFESLFNLEFYKQDEVFLMDGTKITLTHAFLNKNFNESITFKQDNPAAQVDVYFLHNLHCPLSSLLDSSFSRTESDIGNLMIWYKYIKSVMFGQFGVINGLEEVMSKYERILFDKVG